MALGSRLKGYDSYTYVIMGDGEIQEGCVWEAALSASKFKADHLIGILDNNGVQLDGTLEDIMPMGDIKAKWEAFGWNVIPCDGHDVDGRQAIPDTGKDSEGKGRFLHGGQKYLAWKSHWRPGIRTGKSRTGR